MVRGSITLKHKLNHSGSTLLMVILCIAFLGILGSLILSISMVNLQMKRVESKSKDNFYYCEKALEEIRLGVEELTMESIKEAYQEVLNDYIIYSAKDVNTRNKEIQNLVLDKLSLKLKGDGTLFSDSEADYAIIAEHFKDFLSLSKSDEALNRANFDISISKAGKEELTSSYTFLFKNIKIVFKQNDYDTSITSDLRVNLPSFTFTKGGATVTYSMTQPYEGYALVADGIIRSENKKGENTVIGNVYAGEGISVKDTELTQPEQHKLTVNGNYIVTRGNIQVVDTAELTIGDSGQRPLIWANNLIIGTTKDYLTGNSVRTKLLVNAICLMKDDLTVDGRNSDVKLSGAYVGYTGEHTEKGSAIMMNGSGASLDLEGISSMVLAGRAHVSVEDSVLRGIFSDASTEEASANVNIMTGESLAFKSNQWIYLVPGNYINIYIKKRLDTGIEEIQQVAAMHNPLTEDDLILDIPQVNITTPAAAAEFNYSPYISGTKQFKMAAKQITIGGDTLRYYYLNFASGMLADQYLVDYVNKYPEALQRFNNFALGSVTLPTEENADIVSVGNLMKYNYDEASGTNKVQFKTGKSSLYPDDASMDSAIADLSFSTINKNGIYNNTALSDKKVSDLSNLYFNMTHYLTPTAASYAMSEEAKVVDSTVRESGIIQASLGYTPKNTEFTFYNSLAEDNTWRNIDPTAKSIAILTGDVKLADYSRFNGILITTGNIEIGENAIVNGIIIAGRGTAPGNVTVNHLAKVYGRIIATGDIILKEDCLIDCTGRTTFDVSLDIEDFLENLFQDEGQLLWKLFVAPEVSINTTSTSTSDDMVNISNLVSYENWRKNKD